MAYPLLRKHKKRRKEKKEEMNKTKMTKFCMVTFIALFLFSASNIGSSRNYTVGLAKASDMVHQSVAYMDNQKTTNATSLPLSNWGDM